MLRWIKKKCKLHGRKPVITKTTTTRANQSCHEGIDFHIYEEVPAIGTPKAELAYCIVPLVEQLSSKQDYRNSSTNTSYSNKTPSNRSVISISEIICSLCEKPFPGVMDVPDSVVCRCSGLHSFRSSNGDSSSDKFSWLDYDSGNDVRYLLDLAAVQSRVEARARSRQPIYVAGDFEDEDFVERRFQSDDSGGFFDTDNSGNNTDSSLEDSIVNNLDSLDLADAYESRLTVGMSPAPRMGCLVRRTRSAHDSLCGSAMKVSIITRPRSDVLTPAKISVPVPVLGVHRSTEKSTLLRSSLKRRFIQAENKSGQYASIRRGLQCYGRHEADMGYEPASTDEEDVCINVEYILRARKTRGKKCLLEEFDGVKRTDSSISHKQHDSEFFV